MLAALLLAPLLVFHGNVALLEDVYRSALDLPASTRAIRRYKTPPARPGGAG